MVSKEEGSGGKTELLGVGLALIAGTASFLGSDVGPTRGFVGGKMAERAASAADSLSGVWVDDCGVLSLAKDIFFPSRDLRMAANEVSFFSSGH